MKTDRTLFAERILSGLPSYTHNAVLLAAVSGGADSTALLLSIHANLGRLGSTLSCIHVDHGLRSETERLEDRAALKKLCRNLHVPCSFVHIKPGRIASLSKKRKTGTEAAARMLRHKALYHEARRVGADWILLGHTADDMYENILMALLRGSGPEGLVPLPYRRGILLRPLLHESRTSIIAYLESRNTEFKTDSTNADITFYRNRVRHSLVPVLDRDFPDWKKTFISFARTQELVTSMIKSSAEASAEWIWNTQDGFRGLQLDSERFFACDQLVREELLYRGINQFRSQAKKIDSVYPFSACSRGPRRLLVRSFASGGVSSLDMGDLRLQRSKSQVRIERGPRIRSENSFSLLIYKPGIYTLRFITVQVKQGTESLSENTECPGIIQSNGPLVFRTPFPEDQLQYRGSFRPLKKVLEAINAGAYTDIMVVEDAEGVVALVLSAVDSKVTIFNREKDMDAGSQARDLFFLIKPRGDYA